MGSNPIEDATLREKVDDSEWKVEGSILLYLLLSPIYFLAKGAARYAIWQSGEAQTFVLTGSTPVGRTMFGELGERLKPPHC